MDRRDKEKIARELVKVAKNLVSARKEYAIWGVPESGGGETLLMAKFKGKEITDKNIAKKLADILVKKYGAKKVRIQEVDTSGEFDWLKEIQ